MNPPPALGRDFPVITDEPSSPISLDSGPRPAARTQLFGGAPTPPPPINIAAGRSPSAHSVSIVMPAPDGSMMAPLSRGPADYVIVRNNKRHGPYDLGQLERLIPMGKLRSVDSIEVASSGQKLLAVDLPGLRPLFEERARAEEKSVVRPMPVPIQPAPAPDNTRNRLWAVIGVLAFGLVAAAAFLAFR